MEGINFIKCPICKEYLEPQIRRCKQDSMHIFHVACIRRHKFICNICDGEVLKTNDESFDKLLFNLKIKCKYPNCDNEVFLQEKTDHELECKHRNEQIYLCEMNNFCKPKIPCKWQGTHTEIYKHFRTHVKPSFDHDTIKLKLLLNVKNNYKFIQLIEKHNELFWFKQITHAFDQKVYFLIQLIGSCLKAKQFGFKINFVNFETITIEGDCLSDSEDILRYALTYDQIKQIIKNDFISFKFTIDKRDIKIEECSDINYCCEINKFCKLKTPCLWEGSYEQIYKHFRTHVVHPFDRNPIRLKMSIDKNYKFIQIIRKHNELFWYKHFVDVEKEKIYFAAQLIGESDKKFRFKVELMSILDPNLFEVVEGDCVANQKAEPFEENCSISFCRADLFIENDFVTFNFKIDSNSDR